MMKKKAQLFSSDLAIAMIVFTFALALAILVWDGVTGDINSAEELRDMEALAVGVIENLVRSPGVPADWNPYDVMTPGLAVSDRVLDEEKISDFTDLMSGDRYGENKYKLGIGHRDFYLRITDINGTAVMVDGQQARAGLAMDPEAAASLTTARTATLGGETVVLTFTIWT